MAVKAIKYGMKGDPVANLQTTLNKYGYNLAVDGSFGPKTLAAVKDYQKKNGLTVDGMVGPQTQAALFSNTSSIAPTVSNPAAEDRPMAKDEENDPMPSVPPGVTNTVALPENTQPAAGTGNANPTVVPGSTNPAVPENTQPAVTGGTNTAPATGGGSKNTAGSTAPAVNYPDPFTYGDFSYDDYVSSGAVAKASEKPFSYGDFSYGGYQESETVKQASAALDAVLAAQPGAYQSKWADQVNSIIDKILNRESFNYNFNEDPLYWQYADQYTRKGKLAMQDTMGQAAALTGGYGNSYASTAGNQAYQEYLSQLNEVIPELRRMALDEYNMEGQELYNQYGLLSDQEAQDYGRYMDSYNQWLSERDYASGRYDSERNFDYGKYADDRNFAYGQYADDRNLAYKEYLNAIELAKWQETDEYNKYLDDRNFAYGAYADDRNMAYDQYLDAVQQAQWGAEWDASEDQRRIDNDREDKELGMKEESWNIEKSAIDDSTKSYSGNGFNNGTLTNGQIKELQSVLGVEADGKFGPKTKEAAGGLSADEAYAKYVGGSSATNTFKGLTASEAKGVASQIAEYADNEDLEGAEAYLTYLVANEYITEEEAKSFLAPYVNVEEDEVVDTTVPTTAPTTTTGSNTIPPLTTGTDYPILISPEQAGAFANGTLTPEELMKAWLEVGQFTGMTPEQWVKTLK